MEQGVMEGIIAGNMRGLPLGPGTLLFYAVSLMIPLVMAFLSLTLKDSMNRRVNIIVGVVYTVLYLCDLVAHLAVPYAYAILMGVASVVVQLLIVWYAWNWPKERIAHARIDRFEDVSIRDNTSVSPKTRSDIR
jgi:heme A synthase